MNDYREQLDAVMAADGAVDQLVRHVAMHNGAGRYCHPPYVLCDDGKRLFEAVRTAAIDFAQANRAELVELLERAWAHIDELAEAWRRGVIRESDGMGGLRSNANAELVHDIGEALAELRAMKEGQHGA